MSNSYASVVRVTRLMTLQRCYVLNLLITSCWICYEGSSFAFLRTYPNTRSPSVFPRKGQMQATVTTLLKLRAGSTNDNSLNKSGDQCWPFHGDECLDIKNEDNVTVLSRGDYGNVYGIDFDKLSPSSDSDERRLLKLGSLKFSDKSDECVLCIHRFKIWWMRPVHVKYDAFAVPEETLMILGKFEPCTDSMTELYQLVVGLALPSINDDGCSTCYLTSARQSGNLSSGTFSSDVYLTSETGKSVALYCGIGKDPFKLIEDAMTQASLLAYATTDEKDSLPMYRKIRDHPLLGKLGWCTWNSFYTDIDGKKILKGCETLHQSGVKQVGFVIIDDGWQHTTNDFAQEGEQWFERLSSMEPSPIKFGRKDQLSLRATVSALKEKRVNGGGGCEYVFVWHGLPGYWLGVEESNFVDLNATTFFPKFSDGIIFNDFSILREKSITKGIGVADPSRFYQEYHSKLAASGIDGVKVDAQGVAGYLCPKQSKDGKEFLEQNNHRLAVKMHEAIAKSIQSNFVQSMSKSSNIIHCMCHAPEIFFRFPLLYNSKPIIRASDDYYPGNKFSHGPHLIDCAFNSLIFGHFAIPDWDMFTTIDSSESQVAARAISGGPVYISDIPGTSDLSKLDKLVCEDGTVLLCNGPLLPAREALLCDPSRGSSRLILWNTNKDSGVIGVFDVGGSAWSYNKLNYIDTNESGNTCENIMVTLSPNMIEPYRNPIAYQDHQEFLVYSSFSEFVEYLPSINSTLNVEVGSADIFTVIPIQVFQTTKSTTKIAPIGLRDMYNPNGCITHKSSNAKNSLQLKTIGCGKFLVATTVENIRITLVDKNSDIMTKVVREGIQYGSREAESFFIIQFELPPSNGDEQLIEISLRN